VTLSGFSIVFPQLSLIIWVVILIFRSFPIFFKFFIEWELMFMFLYNYGLFGLFIFCVIFLFGVLGLSRNFFIILYGQPRKKFIKSVDLLKRDVVLSFFIIFLFVFINYFIIGTI
jgi:hypothetical protein